jgi:hypothetical protein
MRQSRIIFGIGKAGHRSMAEAFSLASRRNRHPRAGGDDGVF